MTEHATSALDAPSTDPASAAASGRAVLTPSRGLVVGLLALVLLSAALGLLVGRGGVLDFGRESLFLGMRAYRVAVAFLCGGALSVSGVVVQTLFRNPLASPQILGTTSGAILGAHAALLVSVFMLGGGSLLGIAPELLIPLGALLGAGLSLLLLLTVVSLQEDSLALLLTGYALMSLFQSASTFLSSISQEAWELNRAFASLNQGDISASGPRQLLLMLAMALGGVLPVFASSSTLDVLLAGDEEARTLGVATDEVRFWLVLWVAVLTGGAVAVGGGVGFVGLIVPHALRPRVGQRHRYLVPLTFVAGGGFVVLCDALCRLVPV
ncbi:MAG: iron chelate uptake ABC transporter family permease subunit, partial [Polyangiales bacterium]